MKENNIDDKVNYEFRDKAIFVKLTQKKYNYIMNKVKDLFDRLEYVEENLDAYFIVTKTRL